MNPRVFLPVLAVLLPLQTHPTLRAQDAPAAVTPAQMQRVLEMLVSEDPERRAAAYRACRERGEEFQGSYLQLLNQARSRHGEEMARVVASSFGPRSQAVQLRDQWFVWKPAADAARAHIQTDHGKEQRLLDEMDRLFASAERAWRTVSRSGTRLGEEPGIARLQASLDAMVEIQEERAWAAPRRYSAFDLPDLGELLREFAAGSLAHDTVEAVHEVGRMARELEAAHATNEAMRWASPAQKTFARILNDRRVAVGLAPLILDEKLSKACELHSEEMERLGYFSHESPVPENRTFGMRAVKAGFQGASGECIYMGSPDPASAESAWWYSCGHRLINYSSSPNTLGIGLHNRHWTLNTGNVNR